MKPRKGFTLLEVLVVIAVICVVMAILTTCLLQARNSARAAVCMANLRQLGVGFISFGAEHAGRLPGSHTNYRGIRECTPDNPDGESLTADGAKLHKLGFDPVNDQAMLEFPQYEWMGDWLSGLPGNYTDYDGMFNGLSRKETRTGFYCQPTRGTIFKYVNTARAYRCPVLNSIAIGQGGQGYGNGQYDYTMVQYLSGSRVERIQLQSQANDPSGSGKSITYATPVLLEEAPAHGLNTGGSSLDGAWCNNDETSFNHKGGTNIMTLDGSAYWFVPPTNFRIKARWQLIRSSVPPQSSVPDGAGGAKYTDNTPYGWYSSN